MHSTESAANPAEFADSAFDSSPIRLSAAETRANAERILRGYFRLYAPTKRSVRSATSAYFCLSASSPALVTDGMLR